MKRRPFDMVRLGDVFSNDEDKEQDAIPEDGQEEW